MSDRDGLRLYGMDREVEEAVDRACAADPFYLPSETLLPSNMQGFCLCRPEDKRPAACFYCLPYTARRGWRRERVLHVLRPLLLASGATNRAAGMNAVIREIHGLAGRAGVLAIDVELYARIDTPIFFPSGTCAVSSYNAPEWIAAFEGQGFKTGKVWASYELDPAAWAERGETSVTVRRQDAGSSADRELYYRVWSRDAECPYGLGRQGLWPGNAFGWPRPWYGDLAHVLDRDDYVLFAHRDGEVVGLLHWWPNLYALQRQGGRSAVFVRREAAAEALAGIREAKVFKLITTPKAGDYRAAVEGALISAALEIMRTDYDCSRCQIANLDQESGVGASLIEAQGGRKVHELRRLHKPYFGWFK